MNSGDLLSGLINIIRHRLQKTPEGIFICVGDLPVLFDYLSLYWAQVRNLLLPGENKYGVYAQTGNRSEISGVWIASTALIAALGISVHTTGLGQIFLAEP